MQYLHRVTAVARPRRARRCTSRAILADSYAHVGWLGAIVPFTSGFRPTWVGLGTLAVYTFVLVDGRRVRPRTDGCVQASALRVWRGLHGLAYVGWGMAMLHGLKSGTDSGVGWVRCSTSVAASPSCGSLAVRIAFERTPDLVRAPLINRPETPYQGGSRLLIKDGVGR